MASSLSLVTSEPDPEQNLPHADDERPGPETADKPAPEQRCEILPPTPSDLRVPASEDVLTTLRRTSSEGCQPPDSVIRSTAEAARVLTGADGVAIAFRNKGVISCRARSGELAPALGSSVNANSGISGECLRTASILVCQDARTDTRVDNLVCERMGIRSIVVVPLRGPVGISGILEVFSTRANAFGNREINSLRGLAELAEAAYEQERRVQQEATRAALRSAHRLPGLLARAVRSEAAYDRSTREFMQLEGETHDARPERLLWIVGVAAAALLLILGIWLSWRGPITELTELEAAENRSPATPAAPQIKELAAAPKPDPGIVRAESQKKTGASLKVIRVNADASKANSSEFAVGFNSSPAPATISPSKTPNSAVPAPPVIIRSSDTQAQLPGLLSSSQQLPVTSAPVSGGVEQGELIRKVDPVYPLEARAKLIAGPVVLEIHVAEDGTVRDVKTVTGDPQLASAAVDAVRRWRYAPTLLDGHSIETTKQVTVLFKLQ